MSVKSLPQAIIITVDYAREPHHPEVFIQQNSLHLVVTLADDSRVETEIPFSEPVKGQISLMQSGCQLSMILPKNQPALVTE